MKGKTEGWDGSTEREQEEEKKRRIARLVRECWVGDDGWSVGLGSVLCLMRGVAGIVGGDATPSDKTPPLLLECVCVRIGEEQGPRSGLRRWRVVGQSDRDDMKEERFVSAGDDRGRDRERCGESR